MNLSRLPDGIGKAQKWLTQYLADLPSGSPTDPCILLPFSGNSYGYAQVRIPGMPNQVLVSAVVLEHVIGPRPDGLDACHSCDTPMCIAQYHLRWDTRGNNIRDAIKNGRWHNMHGNAERERFGLPRRR